MTILSADFNCDLNAQSLSANGVFFLGAVCALSGRKIAEPTTVDEFESLQAKLDGGEVLEKGVLTAKNYEDYFDTLLERNRGALLHVSATEQGYALAKKAVAVTSLKFPKREIYLVNNAVPSSNARLLIKKALRMKENGMSASEIFVNLTQLAENTETLVVASSVEEMTKSGYYLSPCSGKTLSVRSVFLLKEKARLLFRSKGSANTAERIFKKIKESANEKSVVCISAGADETAQILYEKLIKADYEVDFEYLGLNSIATFGRNSIVVSYERSV